MTFSLTRRAAVAGIGALAAAPAFAQSLEEKGYALGDIPMGPEDALVTVIEYASLTCPHCAAFHDTNWAPLKENYIDQGKVRFIMREVYFDQFGLWAAMVARAGGETSYHRMIDMLLKNQQTWYQAHIRAYQQTKNPRPIVDSIMQIGRQAGMSNQRMTEALQDAEYLETLVREYQEHAKRDNIRSTPSFLINGDLVTGNMAPSAFAAEIDSRMS